MLRSTEHLAATTHATERGGQSPHFVSPSLRLPVTSPLRLTNFRARAFTLVEMITVLTILILVLAIAIPVWNALMNGTNLSTARNQIAAYLANARADAIYNRQMIGVCFFIDPKTQQTAMAEVQVQNLYQPHPYSGTAGTLTSQFIPGTWSGGWSSGWQPFPSSASVPNPSNPNGMTYSIELVNTPDPSNPGKQIFYRDVVLLPKGAAVALTNNTYGNFASGTGYNANGLWDTPNTNKVPPLDRYVRFGCIMFNTDGTIISIPFAVPVYEAFNASEYSGGSLTPPPVNFLYQRIVYPFPSQPTDIASNVAYAPSGTTPPPNLPLWSSVGLVIYDHDAYLSQHTSSTSVMDNSSGTPQQTSIGDNGIPYSDSDLNISFTGTLGATAISTTGPVADKYLEESWIDKNGTAFLINPADGSLIQAK